MIGTRNVSILDRSESQDIFLKSFSSQVGLTVTSEMGIKGACQLKNWILPEIQMKSAFLGTFLVAIHQSLVTIQSTKR